MNKLRQTAVGGGKLLSLAALVTIVLGCAAPAHADSINLSFDTSNATLRGSGKYLRYRNVITVDNSNSYGFTLSMYANNPDLVNSSDSNYVINSVSGHNRYLGANQWGYSMTGDSGTFNEIPNSSYNAATLADVTNDAKGVCDRVSYCGIPITFGANIEPKKSASGYYSTTLTYTATSKPAPDWNAICRDRYYSDYNKQSYCVSHKGDMSGYRVDWSRICSERYPGSSAEDKDKLSYCTSHQGDMSSYQPNWNSICSSRYPDNVDKQSYCVSHQGDISGWVNWIAICSDRYLSGESDPYKFSYCVDHHGDMSRYRPPRPPRPVNPVVPPRPPHPYPVHGGID